MDPVDPLAATDAFIFARFRYVLWDLVIRVSILEQHHDTFDDLNVFWTTTPSLLLHLAGKWTKIT